MASKQSAIVIDPESSSDPQIKKENRGRSTRWRIWAIWILPPLGIFIAIVIGSASMITHRIETDAEQVAEIGTSIKDFTSSFALAVKNRDLTAILALHDENYTSAEEGIWEERLRSDQDGVRVYAWHVVDPGPFQKSDVRGQFERHLATIGSISDSKFKVTSIEDYRDDGFAVIQAVLWLRGTTEKGEKRESHATFRLRMVRSDGAWLVRGKALLEGQTVIGQGRGFHDVTASAGIDFQAAGNPMYDQSEWRPEMYEIFKYGSAGVATCDYDNDGWYDIFFSDGDNPCLYRNRRDGTFEDVTAAAGLPVGMDGVQVAIFADFDNDTDRDLFLGRSTGENRLFENNGQGQFEDVTATANVSGEWVTTAAAADYDNDGMIDLYLGRYLDPRSEIPTTNFYTRNGQGNALLRNEGKLRFKDVTQQAGVMDGGLTLAAVWGDYDQDGDQDVYVANDFGRNALFRNNADGTFTDVAKETGTVCVGYGMSASFEDVDNDGDLDLYVSGVHSGQRWFGNAATIKQYVVNSIKQGAFFDDLPVFWDMNREINFDWKRFGEQIIAGNSLMLNKGDGTFADVTEKSLANPHGWFWGSGIFDLDNDTRQDIYSVNGWITGKEKDDL